MKKDSIKLLLDEHIWEGLVDRLEEHGYDVEHINRLGKQSIDDPDVFDLAASQNRAVLTFNHRDFVPIAREWYELELEHAGLILSIQLPRGELLKQVVNLLSSLSTDEFKNTARWLQEFKE